MICPNEVPKKITLTSIVCQFNLPPRKFNLQAVQSGFPKGGNKITNTLQGVEDWLPQTLPKTELLRKL